MKKTLLYIISMIFIISLVNAIDIFPAMSENTVSGNVYYAECEESWTCGLWSSCSGGTQTRTCTDSNFCGTTNDKPVITQSCTDGTTDGGGSSSGSTSLCPDGKIVFECYCEQSKYTSGYCFENLFYEENPFIIPTTNDTIIVSPDNESFYFTIYSDLYAYKQEDNFDFLVSTYKYNQPVYADNVYFEVYMGNFYVGKYYLKTVAKGIYSLTFDNNLDVGDYTFKFIVENNDVKLTQEKKIKIDINPDILNRLYTPSGKIKEEIILTFSIIIILLIIIILNIKKIKNKIKKWEKKKS